MYTLTLCPDKRTCILVAMAEAEALGLRMMPPIERPVTFLLVGAGESMF